MAKLPWYLKQKDYDKMAGKVILEIRQSYIIILKIKLFFSYYLKVLLQKIPLLNNTKKVKS